MRASHPPGRTNREDDLLAAYLEEIAPATALETDLAGLLHTCRARLARLRGARFAAAEELGWTRAFLDALAALHWLQSGRGPRDDETPPAGALPKRSNVIRMSERRPRTAAVR